jgi:alkanesulfonate monooxygenase SsuD/methylene tetrahydromethanopterin reductase-like flavin-dependent oxidoreductase (luciferase family)
VRLGIRLDLRNPEPWRRPWADHYAWTLSLVEQADAQGAATVYLTEHHFFADGYLPQPLTFAAAIAARTSRIRIGTAVMLPALRPAVGLAEEAAVVDVLSAGRLDLGFGAGYRRDEFDAFGVDLGRRFQLVEERVSALRELWAGAVTPKPMQHPLPLWGGFYGPRGARLAGRLGMGLLAAEQRLLAPYTEGLADAGHNPAGARMRAGSGLLLADDPEATAAVLAPHIAYQLGSDAAPAASSAPVLPSPEIGRLTVVDVAQAEAHLRALVGTLPVDEMYLWGSIGGMPRALAERHVELACTSLGPRLRDVGAVETA